MMRREQDKRNLEERKKFIKEAFKEAFKEYLDEKIKQFGRWSLHTLFVAILIALIYFILTINGWQHVPLINHDAQPGGHK